MKPPKDSTLHTPFGLTGIFDNVRDGLVLVRFPRLEIVLFNRSAGEMTGLDPKRMLGAHIDRLFADRAVIATMRRCAKSPVGVWPGHFQDVQHTRLRGTRGNDDGVELHFCRVDPADLAGPLVLLVMRPFSEVQLEKVVRQYSRHVHVPTGRAPRRPSRANAPRRPSRAKRPARKRAPS